MGQWAVRTRLLLQLWQPTAHVPLHMHLARSANCMWQASRLPHRGYGARGAAAGEWRHDCSVLQLQPTRQFERLKQGGRCLDGLLRRCRNTAGAWQG